MENKTTAEVATQEQVAVAESVATTIPFLVVDLEGSQALPDLDEAEVIELDLMSDYWSPTEVGEFKNVFFSSIKTSLVNNQFVEGEVNEMATAHFFEKKEDGTLKQVRNSSKRLVGQIEQTKAYKGMAMRIVYNGKKQNKTNPYHSDDWSVFAFKAVEQ